MRLALITALAAFMGFQGAAEADYFSYTDDEGVVHFTNFRPKRRGKWKRVMREAPAGTKASARRGTCDRCDRVPAKDRDPARYRRFDPIIREASELYRIPVELIRAVIKTESDYDPRVVSSMGARGLMQLMPAAAKDMAVNDVHDPRQNILGGTRYLRILANRYRGDLSRTIAAYHAGPGNLAKYGNNVPPFKRTNAYLKKVTERYNRYRSETVSNSP